MPFFLTIWTDEIEEYLALHGVTREEFEEVVFSSRRSMIEQSRSSENLTVEGFTTAGRHLRCVFAMIDETTILPVTAYEPTEA